MATVRDSVLAGDDDGLHTLFTEVMESHDIPSMARQAVEWIAASIEFDRIRGEDRACLENACELLSAIERVATGLTEEMAFLKAYRFDILSD